VAVVQSKMLSIKIGLAVFAMMIFMNRLVFFHSLDRYAQIASSCTPTPHQIQVVYPTCAQERALGLAFLFLLFSLNGVQTPNNVCYFQLHVSRE